MFRRLIEEAAAEVAGEEEHKAPDKRRSPYEIEALKASMLRRALAARGMVTQVQNARSRDSLLKLAREWGELEQQHTDVSFNALKASMVSQALEAQKDIEEFQNLQNDSDVLRLARKWQEAGRG
jgi:hypothetical protein